MKRTKNFFGIIAILAIIGLTFISCKMETTDTEPDPKHQWCEWTVTTPATLTSFGEMERICINCYAKEKRDSTLIGSIGPGGGTVFYHNPNGFTVTGADSFTAYCLEAAPTNQATRSVTWSSTYVNVTGATGTAIGTGKANTAAIIAAHSSDTAGNNAAKAAVAYTGGGKSDWFLPSIDELNEMYKARTHLGISSGIFWSSSQIDNDTAWTQSFANVDQHYAKDLNYNVRAVRAF